MLVAPCHVGMQMPERRRAERVRMVEPSVGIFRIVEDVEIHRLGIDEAFVIAPRPIPRGERLLLEMPDVEPPRSRTTLVRALENRVHVDNGVLRWLVRLAMSGVAGHRQAQADDARPAQAPAGSRVVAAIVRRVPIRLVEASASGCRFQSPASIDVGTVGFVELRTAERSRSEALRVSREMRTRESIWPHEMAAEFLTVGPSSPESLRGIAAIIAVGDGRRDRLVTRGPGDPNSTIQ